MRLGDKSSGKDGNVENERYILGFLRVPNLIWKIISLYLILIFLLALSALTIFYTFPTFHIFFVSSQFNVIFFWWPRLQRYQSGLGVIQHYCFLFQSDPGFTGDGSCAQELNNNDNKKYFIALRKTSNYKAHYNRQSQTQENMKTKPHLNEVAS